MTGRFQFRKIYVTGSPPTGVTPGLFQGCDLETVHFPTLTFASNSRWNHK